MIDFNRIKDLLKTYNFVSIDVSETIDMPAIVKSFINAKGGNSRAWSSVKDINDLSKKTKHLMFSLTSVGDLWMNYNTSETMIQDKKELGKKVLQLDLKDLLLSNFKGKKKKLIL